MANMSVVVEISSLSLSLFGQSFFRSSKTITIVCAISMPMQQNTIVGKDQISIGKIVRKDINAHYSLNRSLSGFEFCLEAKVDEFSEGQLNQRSLNVDSEGDNNINTSYEGNILNKEDNITLDAYPVGDDLKEKKNNYNYGTPVTDISPNEIGLACIPVQRSHKVRKNGTNLTIMCVGMSGVGKTSFINTLFDSLRDDRQTLNTEELEAIPSETCYMQHHKMDLVEGEFTMTLNVVDTPGFGSFIENKHCWYAIVRYIDEQYRKLFYQENQPNRSNLVRCEVHACLYFIVPSAKGLSQIDIEAMKSISPRVNLIPIVSKADGFANNEMTIIKQRIREILQEQNIRICGLTDVKSEMTSSIDVMPFSTINSIERHKSGNGKLVHDRKYKWGLSEVENYSHCDFLLLRDFLIKNHMDELISSTENYYEKFRIDFMVYILGKALTMGVYENEEEQLGIKNTSKGTIVPCSRNRWNGGKMNNNHSHSSIEQLIETKTSNQVLSLLNNVPFDEIEEELADCDPVYLEKGKLVKKQLAEAVQIKNQKLKNWKRKLYEKQDQFNEDIRSLLQKLDSLQHSIETLDHIVWSL